MDALNQSSASLPPESDEFAFTGLETAPSKLVKPPRVKRAKAALECRYVQTVPLPTGADRPHIFSMIIGLVVGVYIDDAVIKEGIVDVTLMRPLARLGYMDYAVTESVFAMARPDV
jgi:flavin reductase (DIM6/NTAB) family NADH-FMN oxidoreductase RutF